jgi:hypothetical protein
MIEAIAVAGAYTAVAVLLIGRYRQAGELARMRAVAAGLCDTLDSQLAQLQAMRGSETAKCNLCGGPRCEVCTSSLTTAQLESDPSYCGRSCKDKADTHEPAATFAEWLEAGQSGGTKMARLANED